MGYREINWIEIQTNMAIDSGTSTQSRGADQKGNPHPVENTALPLKDRKGFCRSPNGGTQASGTYSKQQGRGVRHAHISPPSYS